MSVGKTNPMRQMMINMMYLVLTALLALNVSAEILKAFSTVNVGMKKSIALIDQRNGYSMNEMDKLYKKLPDVVKEYKKRAEECNKISTDFYLYVDKLKERIVKESGGWVDSTTKTEIKRESDLNVTANIMEREGNGDLLFKEIQVVRGKYIDLIKKVPSITVSKFIPNITVDAKNPDRGSKTWSQENFYMVPSIAAVTLLTKIQNDIRNTQANILDALLNNIGKDDQSFDNLVAVYQADKAAVAVGEKFTAKVFLAAYDSKQQPEIIIGGRSYEVVNGVATYEDNGAVQGSRDVPVIIRQVNKKTGESKEYPTSIKYDVFNAPAIISATKMNVVYVGLDNPISVSVPGFRPTDVSASITGGGSLRPDKVAGDYLCTVPDSRGTVREITISVSVKLPGGGVKTSGTKNFRIKYMPKPTPYFGSKEGGEISAGEIKLVGAIRVALNDFAFEGIQYKVTKFEMVYAPQKGQVKFSKATGPALTIEMKSNLGVPNKGDRIIVTNIWAIPFGSSVVAPTEKKVGDLVLTVK